MATTVNNSLSGPAGTQPSASTLARTARAGTVGITSPTRATYSAGQTVHGLTSVMVATHYHRAGTPRLAVTLPAAGPWWARWYVWMPNLNAAGFGIDEVRWHVTFPGTGIGYVTHTTAAGNAGTRLQPAGLASAPINWNSETGSAVTAGQWWRVELEYTGVDLISRIYAGHSTTGARVHTWLGRDVGRSLEVTGYRYRRGVLLQQGATDATTGGQVSARQQQLITLGYLGVGGADGQYGPGTAAAVLAFQTAFGVTPLDGEIGPETAAAMDLRVAEVQGTALPPPLWLSHVAVSDSGPLGPAVVPGGSAVASLASLAAPAPGMKASAGEAVASLGALAAPSGGRGGDAVAVLGAAGVVDGQKAGAGSVEAFLGVVVEADGTKHAQGVAVAQLGMTAAVEATKHSGGQAVAELALTTLATQLIEPVPPVEAVARVVRQPGGKARPGGRPAGTAYPSSRLGGSATRR